jgi:single-strand DNA-binding protein
VNKWIGIGRLGRAPEKKVTQSGQSVCSFSIACDEKWKDKQGQNQEKVEWVQVVAWGRLADLCAEYLDKGRECYIEGKLSTREWEDKQGNKRQTTEVVAHTVQFLGGKSEKPAYDKKPELPDDSSDVPF